jgi:hypothetical protein
MGQSMDRGNQQRPYLHAIKRNRYYKSAAKDENEF